MHRGQALDYRKRHTISPSIFLKVETTFDSDRTGKYFHLYFPAEEIFAPSPPKKTTQTGVFLLLWWVLKVFRKKTTMHFTWEKWTGTIKMWIFSRYTRRYPFQETVDLMGEFECRSKVNKFHVFLVIWTTTKKVKRAPGGCLGYIEDNTTLFIRILIYQPVFNGK